MDGPLVSVIMPTYNHERYVAQAISSVMTQTYANLEFIIIDDGSSDATPAVIADVIARYPERKTIFLSQKNQGVSKTLNRGIALSSGEYLAFIASDDIYLPARIEEGVKALRAAGADVGGIYSDGFTMNERGENVVRFSSEQGQIIPLGRNLHRELLLGNWIAFLSILFRRDAFLACGLFDEGLEVEDYDYLLRFTRQFHLSYLPLPLFRYRLHAASYSRDRKRMAHQYALIAERHPDLASYLSFLDAVKSRSLAGIIRNLSMLNLDLLRRKLVRALQRRSTLMNVGYGELSAIVVRKAVRRACNRFRALRLRMRGVSLGPGTTIAGRVTLIGNPRNIRIGAGVRFLGDARLVTESGREREHIEIGDGTTLDHDITLFTHGGDIVIGADCFIGERSHIQAKGGVTIGDHTMIAGNCSLYASNHVTERGDVPFKHQGETFRGITIGANSWLGTGVTVVDGTVIGDDCIVGAGCVARGEYPRGSTILARDLIGRATGSETAPSGASGT